MHDIRAVDPELHLDELAELLLDAHASNMALGLRGPLTLARARDASRALGDRELLCAFDGGRVVGSGILARSSADNGRHRAEIQRLAVAASHRGTGLGTALLDAAIERARATGITLLFLTTHAG